MVSYNVKRGQLPRIKGRSARIVEYNVVTSKTFASETKETLVDDWQIPIGEAVELLCHKVAPVANMEYTFIKDMNSREWNRFITMNTVGQNTLPFNRPYVFPDKYTLKFSEGDHLMTYSSPIAGQNLSTNTEYTTSIVRRYKTGSGVDYKNFDDYEGGMASLAQFYEINSADVADTSTNTWSNALTIDVTKNEAYYIYTAGVIPVTNLEQTRLIVDDQIEYNIYHTRPSSPANELPFVTTSELDTGYDPTITASVSRTSYISKMIRLNPILKVVKNRNKNLRMQFLDGGTAAADALARMIGVKRIIA